jgi:hypothetical protein
MDQIDETELNSFEIPAEVKENGIALKEIRSKDIWNLISIKFNQIF